MVNKGDTSQQAHEINRAIIRLQAQVRKLSKQIAQKKKAVKEHLCLDGISLDPTIYLRLIQTLEDHFEAKGCSGGESFLITTKKLQGNAYYWFRYLKRERAIQGKPKIKT